MPFDPPYPLLRAAGLVLALSLAGLAAQIGRAHV